MILSMKLTIHVLILIIFLMSIPMVEAKIENVTVKIIPRWLPLVISLGTNSLQAEPGETLNLKAYVRNAYNESMKDVSVWFENDNFTVNITPETVEELKPNEIKSFDVKFAIPKDIKEGDYIIEMKGGSKDFSDPIEDIINLKISTIKTEIYYLTLVIGLSIIGLFIWRKVRTNAEKKS